MFIGLTEAERVVKILSVLGDLSVGEKCRNEWSRVVVRPEILPILSIIQLLSKIKQMMNNFVANIFILLRKQKFYPFFDYKNHP